MMYRVVYTRRSQRDLDKIFAHVAQDSGEQEIARRLITRILDACESLSHFPQRFVQYHRAPRWAHDADW